MIYYAVGGDMTKLVIRDYNSKTEFAVINVGEWCNLRLVYTVANTLNEDGTVAENGYKGNVDVYVNNEFVKSITTVGYNATGSDPVAAGSVSNENLTNIGFEMRSKQWAGVEEVNWAFDNTYIGVLNVEPEAPEAAE